MWSNFFEAGGWGMVPTLGLGFALVASAGLFLLRPEPRWQRVTVSLALVVLATSLLGFTSGCISTLRYVAAAEASDAPVRLLAAGFAESANNLVLAFLFLVLSGLLATGGLVRAGRVASA